MGQYSNTKFHFSFGYPGHIFLEKQEPDAGDGVVLKGRDGLECRVYGAWMMESPKENYRHALQWEKEAGSQITYTVYKKGWYVISGILKGGDTIFYQRTQFHKEFGVTMRWVYRIRDKARYDDLVSEILKRFRF